MDSTKQQILDTILGGANLGQFIAYLIWGTIGIIASTIIETMRHSKTIIASGGFSIKIWLRDNILRTLLSAIALLCIVSFSDQIMGAKVSTWEAFLGGLVIDKVIEALIKVKDNINFDSLWKKTS